MAEATQTAKCPIWSQNCNANHSETRYNHPVMKTLALLLALLALAACTPAEAADPRRPSEADIVAAYEADAIALARQRPEVIKLRFALAKATTEAEKKAVSSALYALMEEAASRGRQAGLAAVEAQRRRIAQQHAEWDTERRHQELLWTLQNLRLR